MTRRFSGGRLVIATHNPGKVREFDALLGPCGVAAVAAGELGLPEPEETGLTFRDNALIKAHAAAAGAGLPALADDSGLACEALDGAPGIHSARWAGPEKDFAAAMARVEADIGSGSRRAAFVCVLALVWPDGHAETFEGRVEGTLVWPPRGDRGFGYDPMFMPDGHRETFGEMDGAAKHAISHRARAVAALLAGCFGR